MPDVKSGIFFGSGMGFMKLPGHDTPTVYLVDASIYVFRAWFAFPDDIVDQDGQPVNALFGFVRTLCEILEQSKARQISVAFDTSLTTSFRNKIYPEYKANREKAPPELSAQFKAAREFSDALGLHTAASDTYEADDLMATVSHRMRADGFRSCFLTADKDLAQLLEGDDVIWDFARRRIITRQTHLEDVGVRCEQVPDYLALMGDSVDNIPGIKGVGAKSAAALLSKFDDLEDLYTNLAQVESMQMRGAKRVMTTLEESREMAFMFRDLTRLHCDAPLTDPDGIERREPDWTHLGSLIDQYNLGTGFADRLRQAASLG